MNKNQGIIKRTLDCSYGYCDNSDHINVDVFGNKP